MAALNIQLQCERCRYADDYGRDCAKGALLPVLLCMTGRLGDCPEFEGKTAAQLRHQLDLVEQR